MQYLYQIFCLGFICSSAIGPVIDILPSGQGNCVLVSYNNQAILIDAGSGEMHFPAAYKEKVTQDIKEFSIKKKEATSSAFSAARNFSTFSARSSGFKGDDSTESSGDDIPKKSAKAAKRPREKASAAVSRNTESTKEKFRESLFTSIHEKLPRDKHNHLLLKTLVITHPDEDHYNLIDKIFAEDQDFYIESIILGGFYANYNSTFQNWLDDNSNSLRIGGSRIGKIFFTGMADGSATSPSGLLEQGLARSYYSNMLPVEELTRIEQSIEEALSFKDETDISVPIKEADLSFEDEANISVSKQADLKFGDTFDSEPVPKFQILSMNSGHATEPNGYIRKANEDKNTNSIVLRLGYRGQSIIFSADAQIATWRHIASHTWAVEKELKANYLLISHHGSKEDGATTQELLNLLEPQACFISAGRNLRYHHPHSETIELLENLHNLYRSSDYHDVSYFCPDKNKNVKQKFVYRRKSTNLAIFSTLNNGTLSITLGENPPMIRASQFKERIYEVFDNPARKFGVNYEEVYCLEKGKTMYEALNELADQCAESQTNLIFWKPTLEDPNKIQIMGQSRFENVDNTTELHVLAKEDKGRFYFLEEIE